MNFDALIFDCDGVLVNSEEILQDIELDLLAKAGLVYERDDFSKRFLGVSNKDFYAGLNQDSQKLLGHPLNEGFADELSKLARQAFDGELRAFEGIHDLLHSWNRPVAVASSSSVEALSYKLETTKLKDAFDPHIYSTEYVNAGKPHPDIYLFTAEKLQVSTNNCVVVEDSVNGVIAAKSAGMYTVGFTAGLHCYEGHEELLIEAGADLVVDSMLELRQQIVSS